MVLGLIHKGSHLLSPEPFPHTDLKVGRGALAILTTQQAFPNEARTENLSRKKAAQVNKPSQRRAQM